RGAQMSVPSLPDDPRDWPANPYELLGISPDADRKTARRAYVRLIRVYKPDHFPVEFQILREAFESIEARISRFADRVLDQPEPSRKPSTRPDPSREPSAESDGRESRPSPQPKPPDVQQIWNGVRDGGNLEEGYSRLFELTNRDPSEDVYLALYWLLKTDSRLDPERCPCDWLAAGLQRSSGDRLGELYRRELGANPSEVEEPRCAALLARASGSNPWRLIQARFQAADELSNWKIITQDLEILRGLQRDIPEETWGRILIAAVEHLAWHIDEDAKAAHDRCLAELNELTHLHGEIHNELIRLDFLAEVVAGWKMFSFAGSPALWSLVRYSWNAPPAKTRQRLIPILRQLVASPTEMLKVLEGVVKSGPALAAYLGDTFAAAAEDDWREQREHADAPIASALTRLLEGYVIHPEYRNFRSKLLAFCASNHIHPISVSTFLARAPRDPSDGEPDPTTYPVRLSEQDLTDWIDGVGLCGGIENDGPLNYAYKAHQAFWT
ncbi:MAG: J domain-containing protein, partial [Planctomycetales bacterium]